MHTLHLEPYLKPSGPLSLVGKILGREVTGKADPHPLLLCGCGAGMKFWVLPQLKKAPAALPSLLSHPRLAATSPAHGPPWSALPSALQQSDELFPPQSVYMRLPSAWTASPPQFLTCLAPSHPTV